MTIDSWFMLIYPANETSIYFGDFPWLWLNNQMVEIFTHIMNGDIDGIFKEVGKRSSELRMAGSSFHTINAVKQWWNQGRFMIILSTWDMTGVFIR